MIDKTITTKNALIILFLYIALFIHSAVEYYASQIHYLNTGVFFVFYVVMFLISIPYLKKILSTFSENILLMLVILWAVLSLAWTDSMLETGLAIMSLLGMLLVAAFMVQKFNLKDAFNIFVYFILFSILFNAFFLIFFPELSIYRGIHGHYGKWQGFYWHKNSFGVIFYFAIVILPIAYYFRTASNRWLILIAIFISFLFLLKSDSVTSLFAALICLIMFFFKWLNYAKGIKWRWIIIVSLSALLIFFFFADDLLMYFFGRNLSFTGRPQIWIRVIEVIQESLILGQGYYGFWYDAEHGIRDFGSGWMSHNGYLEILLFLGLIGFLLFLMMWGRAVYLSGKLYFSKTVSIEATFPFVFLVSFSIINTMESMFLLKMNVFTIVFFYCVIYLNQYYSKNRLE